MTLNDAVVTTTLPATDLARARKFYHETLGLEISMDMEAHVMFRTSAGSQLLLYPRGATTADHTVCSFAVPDIEATVVELKAKGVTFEEYDMPGLKTVNGIATIGDQKAAWFKDTEGNILALGDNG